MVCFLRPLKADPGCDARSLCQKIDSIYSIGVISLSQHYILSMSLFQPFPLSLGPITYQQEKYVFLLNANISYY
jgi:hypothetical protein